jgi:hypothetical protein
MFAFFVLCVAIVHGSNGASRLSVAPPIIIKLLFTLAFCYFLPQPWMQVC